jgi:hypothetical protein
VPLGQKLRGFHCTAFVFALFYGFAALLLLAETDDLKNQAD